MDTARASRLMKLLATNPREAFDRIATRLEIRAEQWGRHRPAYEPVRLEDALEPLAKTTGWPLRSFLEEDALRELEGELSKARTDQREEHAFPGSWDAGITLARLCYAVCRASRPATVLETGVARGVTSASILKALDVNGDGELHSIELAARDPAMQPFVGSLIPGELRGRWHLHAGRSRRVLPKLLTAIPEIDLFIQDSLHTYWTTMWELTTVERHMSQTGIVLADDIEGNSAWADWSDRSNRGFSRAIEIEGKGNLCGLAVAPRAAAAASG